MGWFDSLMTTGSYSATWNNMAVGGWAVTFGKVRRGLGGASARPVPSSLYQM